MTFEQAFSKIKEKFDNADASKTSDFAIQITLTDEDCGGTFYAEVKDGKLAVEPYDYYDNNTVLNISKSAILALIAGRVSLDKAIANGEAFVQGDASKIADLKGTIKKASEKKPAAKKTAAKKAAPKKAPAKKLLRKRHRLRHRLRQQQQKKMKLHHLLPRLLSQKLLQNRQFQKKQQRLQLKQQNKIFITNKLMT